MPALREPAIAAIAIMIASRSLPHQRFHLLGCLIQDAFHRIDVLRHSFPGKPLPELVLLRPVSVQDLIIRDPDLRLFNTVKHKLQSFVI